MSDFLKRLGLALHVLFYLTFFANLIAAIILSADDDSFVVFIFLSPISLFIGWGLRWLFTGDIANIIPLMDIHKQAIRSIPRVIKSIDNPLEYLLSPLLATVILMIGVANLYEYEKLQNQWEEKIYGAQCENFQLNFNDKVYTCSDFPAVCKKEYSRFNDSLGKANSEAERAERKDNIFSDILSRRITPLNICVKLNGKSDFFRKPDLTDALTVAPEMTAIIFSSAFSLLALLHFLIRSILFYRRTKTK